MAQLKVPDAPREYSTQYTNLLGVDYQNDQTQVSRQRSPDMVNMISDLGGNPVKRDGYRVVGYGYAAILTVGTASYGVRISSSTLRVETITVGEYEFETTDPHTLNLNTGAITAAFSHQQNLYILTEKCFVKYDTVEETFDYVGIGAGMMSTGNVGETAPVYEDNIKESIISLTPAGINGVVLYDKNLFSIYQQYTYIADGTATQFVIPNWNKIGKYVKVETRDAEGNWQTASNVTLGTESSLTAKTLDGTGTAAFAVREPQVTFTTAPASAVSTGVPNVRITFAPFSTRRIDGVYKGYYNEVLPKLLASGIVSFQQARMFVGEDFRVYFSDVNDPMTITEPSWFDVDNQVTCITRSSNYIAVITKDIGGNTIFLASEQIKTVDTTTNEKETYFTVKPSNSGVGAVSSKCIGVLTDEPMFLSSTGIFGLLTNWQSEKYAVNRSTRINRRLCKESNLRSAVGIAHNDYYYLAINGNMYVLDGRHKESDRAGNKPYEAYFFDGLPVITDMFIIADKMYFSDGTNTYTWNDDLSDEQRYYDNGHFVTVALVQYQLSDSPTVAPTGEWENAEPEVPEGKHLWYRVVYSDGNYDIRNHNSEETGDLHWTGTPVCAKWSSVFDDDGIPQRLKTLQKKGTMITVVPYYHSSGEVTLIKDGNGIQRLGTFDANMQTFANIDFSNFSFNGNDVAVDGFTKKKIKKYKRLQIVVENNLPEPFGLTKIVKTYTIGNYAKRGAAWQRATTL